MSLVLGLCLLMIVAFAEGYEKGYCGISLPQNVSPRCQKHREASLDKQKSTYYLNPPKPGMPWARLNTTLKHYAAFLETHPFLGIHAKMYVNAGKVIKKTEAAYKHLTHSRPEKMSYLEYAEMYTFFRGTLEQYLGSQFRLPAQHELFLSDVTKWLSDELFTDQRLAGTNPKSIQQVTLSKTRGLYWNKLQANLNPKFNWKKAVRKVLGRVMRGKSLKWAVKEGYLFALRYPLCDDMVKMADIVNNNPSRTMWPFLSPIALFASVPGERRYQKSKLLPVAIQMDYTSDSAVYTPNDGGVWTLAKLNVQVTDSGYSQMVEHLGKIHFVAESFCVSMERYLSHRHPLYAMLQYHCRGVFTSNTLGEPHLFLENRFMHSLFAYGWKGALRLIRGASEQTSWDELDPYTDIMKRGVASHRRLPYYPYRDDGKKIFAVIEQLVEDYVNVYYSVDDDVSDDTELQQFVKEISEKGNGKIRGFPSSVESIRDLRCIISRFIWLASAQHAAVNYPLTDYGTYVPNAPTKLYNDTNSPGGASTLLNLPQRSTAELQEVLFKILGSFRYDRLFDYGPLLEDPIARQVLQYHYYRLNAVVEPLLDDRNKQRYKHGHLTYPYFLPRWLPNGIQT